MIKYPPKPKKAAPKAAEAPKQTPEDANKVEPFSYKRKPEADAMVDSFLKEKGPQYQTRIDATPKDYFVRKWVLAQAAKNEQRNDYYASVKATLDQSGHAKLKEALYGKYENKPNMSDEVKERLVLKEAGQRFKTDGVELVKAVKQAVSPPAPKMTP